ncbi:MAG: vWA domain-containing protein [Anaerolineae bacterium]
MASLGDLESLCADCGADFVPPTFTPPPTDTPEPPTDTPPPGVPTPTDTPEPPTDTPTATDTPGRPDGDADPQPGRSAWPPAREHCDPAQAKADVVLVIDASQSMSGAKIAAAKDAACGRLRARTMGLPDDHVGVVAFNQTATLVSPLSGDAAAVEAAIGGIATAPGTRIDAGLVVAEGMLGDPSRTLGLDPGRHRPDGRHPGRPSRAAGTSGGAPARVGGARFAIGLGTDVDRATLQELAAESSCVFISPTTDELRNIYDDRAALSRVRRARIGGTAARGARPPGGRPRRLHPAGRGPGYHSRDERPRHRAARPAAG